MPFAKLCGQSSGLCRVVKEYFKTSGVKKIGMVICSNTGKYDVVPQKKFSKIDKLLKKCTNGICPENTSEKDLESTKKI